MSTRDEIGNLLAASPCSGQIIDARDKFQSEGLRYQVQIEVKITAKFLWSIAKCLLLRKNLRITHDFSNDPLLEGRERMGMARDTNKEGVPK